MPDDVPKEYYTGDWFGPDYLPFEFKGYFEEFMEVEFTRFLGLRLLPELPLGRLPGANHAVELTLTEPLQLSKGSREYTLRASTKRPLRVRSTIQIFCGPTKNLQT